MRARPMNLSSQSCASLILAMLAMCGVANAQQAKPPVVPSQSTIEPANDDIRLALTKQTAAWNKGDIDAFMETYWKSDELTFSSGGKTTRGWTATRDRYKQKYTSPELMGKLTFSELEVSVFDHSTALVLGRWHLERKEAVGGNFSLVLRKIADRWLIIHDHTSASP